MMVDDLIQQCGKIHIDETAIALASQCQEELTLVKLAALLVSLEKHSKAEEILAAIPNREQNKSVTILYNAIAFRLHGIHAKGEVSRWQKKYEEQGVDITFPVNIKEFSVEPQGKELILNIFDKCPNCQGEVILAENGDLCPWSSEESTWLCPHCLAKRGWRRSDVREQLWQLFNIFYQNLPREKDNLLRDEDVNRVLATIMALYPLAPVRFGTLETRFIGHLAMNTSLYIYRKAKGLLPPSLDFIGVDTSSFICNQYLVKKWGEIINLDPAAAQIARITRYTQYEIPELSCSSGVYYFDFDAAMHRSISPYSFKLTEHEAARRELEKMGIPPNAPLALMHVRDRSYGDSFHEAPASDTASRNAEVDNYRKAAEYLASLGYYVLRTGVKNLHPLAWESDHIIDYSNRFRSEFMDIWLFSNAAITFGTSSGPTSMAILFKHAYIVTDYNAPIAYDICTMFDGYVLPKTYYYANSGERVTVSEYVAMAMKKNSELETDNFIVKNCTADDILEAVKEKVSIDRGTWKTNDLVEKLQRRYIKFAFMLNKNRYKNEFKDDCAKIYDYYKGNRVLRRISSKYLLEDYEQECKNHGGAIKLN